MRNNLWWATKYPDRSIENSQRAARVLSFICEYPTYVLYKDIKRELGLSYRQAVRAVGLLVAMDFVTVHVPSVWNGQHYIYPHQITLNDVKR